MTKKEKATALFKEGHNCSQAVLLAFAEDLGLDPVTAVKIATPFGGGMGRMREVCGAFSGLLMAAGLKYASADPKDQKAKAEHYALVQKLAEEFKKQNGSIICRELLGLNGPQDPTPQPRTQQYYQKRPCADMVGSAAEILENLLKNSEK
ncbi:MAG: C_GCAxxG_C_C family protein [Elusimicrobiaceae bacterium]|nr:C_GCAxxG_C_C family protein [Elusimicrobiaceae bacterium]